MNPGSLVVCIDNSKYNPARGLVPQLEPVVYTVRNIKTCQCGCGKAGIRLEELRNSPTKIWIGHIKIAVGEQMYNAEDFREVLPPGQINIEELLNLVIPAKTEVKDP